MGLKNALKIFFKNLKKSDELGWKFALERNPTTSQYVSKNLRTADSVYTWMKSRERWELEPDVSLPVNI